ncbi:hypothetical protein DAEQUDRAFT_467420 [Daedalea quercina L-15889]|uniref:Uncharacterized protein n=1 Tax=Daedalea quercina L-15889 TaxID=1314783 RepID=A0A165TG20_9APHY|nr:hypothetical protein DAEQUDRAFT_467420 [Daedalea quercina L-15889]
MSFTLRYFGRSAELSAEQEQPRHGFGHHAGYRQLAFCHGNVLSMSEVDRPGLLFSHGAALHHRGRAPCRRSHPDMTLGKKCIDGVHMDLLIVGNTGCYPLAALHCGRYVPYAAVRQSGPYHPRRPRSCSELCCREPHAESSCDGCCSRSFLRS